MERTEIDEQTQASQERPLACRRDAGTFTAQQRRRHEQVGRQMREGLEEVRELSGGYAFRFPADTLFIVTLAEFVNLERLCCPFLHFNLELAAGEGPLWLHLTGGPRVKAFLETELAEMTAESRLRP